jgi:hypothetical protein
MRADYIADVLRKFLKAFHHKKPDFVLVFHWDIASQVKSSGQKEHPTVSPTPYSP